MDWLKLIEARDTFIEIDEGQDPERYFKAIATMDKFIAEHCTYLRDRMSWHIIHDWDEFANRFGGPEPTTVTYSMGRYAELLVSKLSDKEIIKWSESMEYINLNTAFGIDKNRKAFTIKLLDSVLNGKTVVEYLQENKWTR